MTRVNLWLFWSFWIVLGAAWLAFNPGIISATDTFALRPHAMQFSGFLAIAAMSAAMILSLRSRWLEKLLNGVDKMYRFHKWLGIGVLSLVAFHWLWSEAPKWAVKAGLISRPARGPRPEITDPVLSFLRSLRDPAEDLGEWAFYAVVVLLIVALVKIIPYRIFRYSHRLLPFVYLVLVFHALVLIEYGMWTTPVGWIAAALMLGGSYAAIVSLFGRIGAGRRIQGKITSLNYYPGVRSLEAEIQLTPGWPGHKAGQFAFFTSNKVEGAHPFTIASDWNPDDRRVAFIAKELGDHTTGLVDRLSLGHEVTVEGPYGCFTFEDDRPRQIWIGGGIGITPFLARMKEMASHPGIAHPEVDLFHCTGEIDEPGLERLKADAAAAGVRLHLVINGRDGLLTGDRIREAVPGWREASLWFCGPSGFGKALRADFAANGFPVDERFHQELFEMR